MKNNWPVFVVLAAALVAIPILNGYEPISQSRQELTHFHIGSVHVRIGYIK